MLGKLVEYAFQVPRRDVVLGAILVFQIITAYQAYRAAKFADYAAGAAWEAVAEAEQVASYATNTGRICEAALNAAENASDAAESAWSMCSE